MTTMCTVSIDNEVWGVASTWRNAYRMMCEHFAGDEHDWALDTIEPELVDDKFAWVDTTTGEVRIVVIEQHIVDNKTLMPMNKWEA